MVTDRTLRLQVFVALALSCGLAIAGYRFHEHRSEKITQARRAELATVARLRTGEVVRWRTDRLLDVRMDATGYVKALLQESPDPTAPEVRERLERHLKSLAKARGDRMVLVRPDGTILSASDPESAHVDKAEQGLIASTLASGQAVMGDLYRCPVCGGVHLDVAAPVPAEGDRPAAVLMARIDAEKTLFPLLHSWPIPSHSAESLLVRKEGSDVVFLNTLRHRADPALSIRLPLSQTHLPAVQAVKGRTGGVEGSDYRGVPVEAEIVPVEGTDWLMISKVDRDEILAELVEETAWIILVVTLAILTVLSLGALVVRNRQARLQAQLLAAERERRMALEEARVTLYSIGDGVIATDRAGLVTRMNVIAESLTGWTEAEARGRPVADVFRIVNEFTGEAAESPIERVLREGTIVGLANHTILLNRDGKGCPIADSGAPIRDDQGGIHGVILVFRDQTAEREAQAALREEERKFQELWRTTAAGSCLDEIVYEDGRPVDYRIVDVNPALERIIGRSRDEVVGQLASKVYGTGAAPFLDIVSRVAETGEPVSFEAFFAPLGRHLQITTSSPRKGWFSNMVTDVTDRRRMEDALHESEAKYRVLLEASPDPIFSLAEDGRYLYANQAFAEGVAQPVDRIIGRTIRDVFPPAEAEKRMVPLAEVFRTGRTKTIEVRVPRTDGDRFYVTTITPVLREAGSVLSAICSSKDITERKRAEQSQARSIRRTQALLELLQKRNAPEDEVVSFAVQKLVEITDSRIVFIGRVDATERTMSTYVWSEQTMKDCRIDNRPEVFDVASGGLWAEPIRRRESVIINDYAAVCAPGRTPAGHVPLVRFLGVPAVHGGRTSLIAGMANKAEPYDEADRHEALLFLEGLYEVLERRKAEALLQASGDRLRLAVSAANVGIWDRDLRTDDVHYSPEWKGQLGYGPDELADNQTAWREHLHPEDRDRVLATLDTCIADPSLPYECEFRMRHKDGSYRWILARADIQTDAEGLPVRMLGTHVDVTHIKQAAADLEHQRTNLRAIMDSAPVPVLVFDEAASVVMANAAAARAFGCENSPDMLRRCGEFIGCAFRDQVPEGCSHGPHCESCVLNRSIREVISGGRGIRDQELEVDVHQAGSVASRWYVASVEPVTLDGRPRAILTMNDITERKQVENALRASERRLRSLYDESPLGYQSLDAEGRVQDVNPRWLEMFGYTRDEVVGRSFDDVLAPADVPVFRERFPRFLADGQVRNVEYRVRHKDGMLSYVSIDGRIGRNPDGSFRQTHCVIRDVTEEKRIELERLRFEATARHHQKLESIGTLAAGVAHEINNPLNVIMNYGQLLLDEPGDRERIADFAGNIVKESDRVATIVRNLLSFSRQDKEHHNPARIADIVERTLSLTGTLLQRDNIVIERDIPEGLPEVACRSQQIQQVVVNLVTNARDALNNRYPKASPDKVIRVSASVFEKEARRWVRLTVADRGMGIPLELAGKVFDPFFTTKARDQGTGLGLSISYGIVTEHRGEIWFESEPGVGTRFHVELPVDHDPLRPNAG